jgi:hypothetical protein
MRLTSSIEANFSDRSQGLISVIHAKKLPSDMEARKLPSDMEARKLPSGVEAKGLISRREV